MAMACQTWALQGYGTPLAIFGLYLVKIAVYIAAWWAFCAVSIDGGIGSWWASPIAFQKAILWTLTFEVLGLGCGSGPLTGRYLPPVGGALYFLRPGTTKLPPFPTLPGLGGHRRTLLDVGLYAGLLIACFTALLSPSIETWQLCTVGGLLVALGLTDKTIFLAARSEHYLSILVCLLFDDWIAGSKVVWLAIWWWAATSKLNHHFPAVMCVMTSNSPVQPFPALKKRLYRNYPDDLRPSKLAQTYTHFGTALEYLFPLVLVMSGGGPLTEITLVIMVVFHLFIMSSVPMGVPLEWNVIMIYGGVVLFGHHADVALFSLSSVPLILWLVGVHFALPLYGSVRPDQVSFLHAMRYYAGNWAYSVWLFEGRSSAKLDRLTKSSPGVADQLAPFYDADTIESVLSMIPAFRLMHLHGRCLHDLLPKAVDDIDDYEWIDGEIVAGLALGWNFGDGHLHGTQLLEAIQAQCHFAPGELRCILVESQPIHRATHDYRIVDAATGELERGTLAVATLLQRQPWPSLSEPSPPDGG
jgi:hypothetical protein